MKKRVLALALCMAVATSIVSGCMTPIMDPPGELERVKVKRVNHPEKSTFFDTYVVELPERRIIRQVEFHALDPLRKTDIFVRDGEDNWRHVKQIMRRVDGTVRVNFRAVGDMVRIVPRSNAFGVISKVDVFVLPTLPD